jgi:hypothetical protein
VGPLGLGDGTFDSHVIDLSVVVSLLPLIVKVGIRSSSNGENGVMGGKVAILLRRFVDL